MIARQTNDKAIQAITVTGGPCKCVVQSWVGRYTIYAFGCRTFASMLPLFAFKSGQVRWCAWKVLPMSQLQCVLLRISSLISGIRPCVGFA